MNDYRAARRFGTILSALLVLLFGSLSVLTFVEGPHIGMGAILFGVSAVFVGGPLLALHLGVTIYLWFKAAASGRRVLWMWLPVMAVVALFFAAIDYLQHQNEISRAYRLAHPDLEVPSPATIVPPEA